MQTQAHNSRTTQIQKKNSSSALHYQSNDNKSKAFYLPHPQSTFFESTIQPSAQITSLTSLPNTNSMNSMKNTFTSPQQIPQKFFLPFQHQQLCLQSPQKLFHSSFQQSTIIITDQKQSCIAPIANSPTNHPHPSPPSLPLLKTSLPQHHILPRQPTHDHPTSQLLQQLPIPLPPQKPTISLSISTQVTSENIHDDDEEQFTPAQQAIHNLNRIHLRKVERKERMRQLSLRRKIIMSERRESREKEALEVDQHPQNDELCSVSQKQHESHPITRAQSLLLEDEIQKMTPTSNCEKPSESSLSTIQGENQIIAPTANVHGTSSQPGTEHSPSPQHPSEPYREEHLLLYVIL